MTERFGAKDERSKMLRFHTQTGGSTLTAQQPENNIVRVTVQSLAAALGGTQSLHTNGFDEALGLPTTRAAKIALRTQQIVGFESGVADTVDPLAGSYFVESLTDEVEAAANAYLERIEQLGGAVAAIEARFMQEEIEAAAYSYAKSVDDGEQVVVGVNRFADEENESTEVFPIDVALQQLQIDRTRAVRADAPGRRGPRARPTSPRRPGEREPPRAHEGGSQGDGHPGRGGRRPARRVRRLPARRLSRVTAGPTPSGPCSIWSSVPRAWSGASREEEFGRCEFVDRGIHDPGTMPFFDPGPTVALRAGGGDGAVAVAPPGRMDGRPMDLRRDGLRRRGAGGHAEHGCRALPAPCARSIRARGWGGRTRAEGSGARCGRPCCTSPSRVWAPPRR